MANIYYGKYLLISAGAVHDCMTGSWLAQADGGKVVKFADEVLKDAKPVIEKFVAEAHAAKKDKLYGEEA